MSDLTSYEQARDWLYSLKNRGSKYGIDRMARFSEALGYPEKSYPCIHVAGTNGKGSTCAMLEKIFRDQGFKVGLSTSPHLVRQGERIQVNRQILAEEQIFEYIKELKPVAESIAEEDPELHPSFFEFMTAMAFLHFQKERVDLAVVEVGLGGRLDATNVLSPELCLITSIGLDHCEILGETLAAIAREKAGIVKSGVPLVVGWLEDEALDEVRSICGARGSGVFDVRDRFGRDLDSYPTTNLSGSYQRINAGLALTAVSQLAARFGIDEQKARQSLHAVAWPARWEERRGVHRPIVFDVTHNAEGARWLDVNLEALVERNQGLRPDIVMGVMGAYRAQTLVPLAAKWANDLYFVVPLQDRACSCEVLRSFVPASFEGKIVDSSLASLFPVRGKCELDQPTSRPLVISGSIYLIGEIWDRYLEESPLGQGALQDF